MVEQKLWFVCVRPDPDFDQKNADTESEWGESEFFLGVFFCMSHAAKGFVGRPVGVGLFYNIEHTFWARTPPNIWQQPKQYLASTKNAAKIDTNSDSFQHHNYAHRDKSQWQFSPICKHKIINSNYQSLGTNN